MRILDLLLHSSVADALDALLALQVGLLSWASDRERLPLAGNDLHLYLRFQLYVQNCHFWTSLIEPVL